MLCAVFSRYVPCPTSSTIRLISFTSWALLTYTPSPRRPVPVPAAPKRCVPDTISSKPQYLVYEPLTVSTSFRMVPPSSVARSPGYCRTTIQFAALPFKLDENVPEYVPPRSQIVSPGCTRPPPPLSAVCRFHGRAELPSPPLVPLVATYQPWCVAGVVTLIVAVPLFPSLVAVIVADPAETAVTRPLAETVATAGALLDHVTTRPVSVLPAASLVAALSCAVVPTRSVLVAGATVTVATGTAVTVIALVPLLPSLVAVIVADPAETAVTRPLAETVATAGALLDHVTTRPVSVLPAESFVTALNCSVAPLVRLPVAGVTATVATGTNDTVIAAAAFLPSLVPVIVTEPAATAVTNPVADTVATPVALLDHVTTRPLSVLPAESLVVAVSWSVLPISRLPDDGVTVTEFTGMSVTVIVAAAVLPSLVAVIVAEPFATAVT